MDCAMDNTSNYFCKGLTFKQITIFESYSPDMPCTGYWHFIKFACIFFESDKKQNNHIDLYLKYQMN